MNTHYNFPLIFSSLEPIDVVLANYKDEISKHPDSFGLVDQFEQFHGIGFAICQTFLASVHKGEEKRFKFSNGPFHSSGKSYAEITNACANYWKHCEEWDQSQLSKDAKFTIGVFEALSVDVWSSYPLSNMLYILLGESATFTELLSYLKE